MNWEAVGAIAELIGAMGVILSLVYLARQIRQSTDQVSLNTTATRATAFQQLLDHHSLFNLKLLEDSALLDALVRSDTSESALNQIDRLRLSIFLTSLFRSQYNGYCLYAQGLITPDQWKTVTASLVRLRSRRIVHEVWQQRRKDYPDDFRAVVDVFLNDAT